MIVAACIAAGCQQQTKEDSFAAAEPNAEDVAAMAAYLSEAFEAAGGVQAWVRTKRLNLDGVVTFYRPDGSFYLTEHHFEIYPWSSSIRISAKESVADFVWEFSPSKFRTVKGDVEENVAPMRVPYRDYAEAVLAVTTAPARFLDSTARFVRDSAPVKMEGLWYWPVERLCPIEEQDEAGDQQVLVGAAEADEDGPATPEPYWSKVVFYQNRASSLVNVLWFADVDEDKFLSVRGYDYAATRDKGVLIPTKIEIFDTDALGVFKERMIEIDFAALR
jgi:hypothetical protein